MAEGEEREEIKLADKIVRGFLEPAASMSDWREKWKEVNRAAGVIAGWALASGGAVAVAYAEAVVRAIEDRYQKGAWPIARQLTDGLRKRLAKILVILEGA